jgi:hypothetical protein
MSKTVKYHCMDTESKLPVFMSKYPDAIKVDGADVYWSDKYGVIALVVSPEWKDYFFERRDEPPHI